jgi:hypothetical protein
MTKTLRREFARVAPKLSEVSRLANQLVSAPRLRRLMLLLTVVALFANIPLHAQTATTGEPRINDINGNPTDSTIFLDAKQYQTQGVGVVADFNLDGKLDVSCAAQAEDSYIFYGKGDGTFPSSSRIHDTIQN